MDRSKHTGSEALGRMGWCGAAALLGMLILPATAHAQTGRGHVDVSGSVAAVCILGAPNPPSLDLGVLSATSGTRAGRLAALSAQAVALPASYCNFAGSVLTVTTAALLASDTSTPQAGFARAVNYTASASGWTTTPAASTSNANSAGGNPSTVVTGAVQASPKLTDIGVQLSNFTVPADAFLVAGTYTGTVTVTLGPAVSGGG